MVTSTADAARYVMVNARTGAPITARLDVVRATGRRVARLLGQRRLTGGEGVRYLVSGAVPGATPRRTERSAVDIAFLDRDGTVLRAVHSLAAADLDPDQAVHSVLELPAGTLMRLETRPGDVLALYRGDD